MTATNPPHRPARALALVLLLAPATVLAFASPADALIARAGVHCDDVMFPRYDCMVFVCDESGYVDIGRCPVPEEEQVKGQPDPEDDEDNENDSDG